MPALPNFLTLPYQRRHRPLLSPHRSDGGAVAVGEEGALAALGFGGACDRSTAAKLFCPHGPLGAGAAAAAVAAAASFSARASALAIAAVAPPAPPAAALPVLALPSPPPLLPFPRAGS